MSFQRKLESIRSNACLAIIGAIRGTSKEKPCQELGLESLQLRRWYRKLGIFTNLSKQKSHMLQEMFSKKRSHMLQKMLTIFPFLISSTSCTRTLSFCRRSLSETT